MTSRPMPMQVSRVERLAASLRFKIVAIIVWLAGIYTTMLCIAGLLPELSPARIWLVALLVQIVLTVAQSEFWSGSRGMVAIIAVIIDALINAAGIWPIMRNFDNTSIWTMLQVATNAPPDAGGAIVLLLTVGLSLFIAAAPEKIWR